MFCRRTSQAMSGRCLATEQVWFSSLPWMRRTSWVPTTSTKHAFLTSKVLTSTAPSSTVHSPFQEKRSSHSTPVFIRSSGESRKIGIIGTVLAAGWFSSTFASQPTNQEEQSLPFEEIGRKEEDSAQVSAGKSIKETMAYNESLAKDRLELQIIREVLGENPCVIEAEKVQSILNRTQLTMHQFLQKLILIGKGYAHPPISNYKVGAVGLGKSGNVYLGFNIEFFGVPLDQAVHGEGTLTINARDNGETGFEAIALSAAPCGFCRQFLTEIGDENLVILTPDKPPRTLSELLPESFGPKDLGLEGGLLTPFSEPVRLVKSDHPDPLVASAIEVSYLSYAPYSKSFSGVAIKMKDGTIYRGCNLDNAAFNPSIPPLQGALVHLIIGKHAFGEIDEVVLAEPESARISHADNTKSLLAKIAPNARFRLEIIKMTSLGSLQNSENKTR